MKEMNDVMIKAAEGAGISLQRAKEIYSLKLLGRELFPKKRKNLKLTFKESTWIVDVEEMLTKEHGTTWHPIDYHRFERGKHIKWQKEHIWSAIEALLGEHYINEPEDKLTALAKGLNDLMVKLFDCVKIDSKEFEEMAEAISEIGARRPYEALTGLEPPD